MKTLILLSTILLLGACTTTPTMKIVVGSYETERKASIFHGTLDDGDTFKLAFLEGGTFETYKNGEKDIEGTWKLVEKEVHVTAENADIGIFRIESNGDLTVIGLVEDDRRKDFSKEKQETWKKLK